jgi:hypothetical protein
LSVALVDAWLTRLTRSRTLLPRTVDSRQMQQSLPFGDESLECLALLLGAWGGGEHERWDGRAGLEFPRKSGHPAYATSVLSKLS